MASDPKRERWLLWVGVSLAFFTYALFTLTVPLYGLQLKASTQVIGVVVALGFLSQVFIAVPLGAAIDRYGIRIALVGGPLTVGVACAIPVALGGMGSVAVSEVLVGIGQIMMLLSSQSETASLSAKLKRTAGFGALTAAVSIGQTLGPLAGGVAIDRFGPRAALATGTVVSIFAATTFLAQQAGHKPRGDAPRPGRAKSNKWASYPLPVWYAFGVSASVVFGRVIFTTFLPIRLGTSGFSAASIGLATAFLGLVTFSVRPVLARIAKALGGIVPATVACTLATGAGIVMATLPPTWVVILLMTALVGFGGGLGQPLSMAMVVDAVEDRQRGVVLASRLVVNRVTQVVGPAGLGLFAGAVSVRAAFGLGGVAILGLVGGLIGMSRRVARRLADSE